MEQLKQNQKVCFTIKDKIYTYEVFSSYLISKNSHPNDQIFKDLELDPYKFCSDCYDYEVDCGAWPNSKDKDYAALTRAVEALFPYCDKVTVDDKVVYSLSKKPTFEEVPVPFFEVESYSSKSDFSNIINFESIVQTSKIKLNFI